MTLSFCTLPVEIRRKIFGYCSKEDLAHIGTCSKSWHAEVTPIAWEVVTFDWKRLAGKNIEIKSVNLKHTRELHFHGRVKDRGDYGLSKFGIMVNSCNPDWLTSLSFTRTIMPDGLQLICERLPKLQCLKFSEIRDDTCFDFVSRFQQLETFVCDTCVIEDYQVEKICDNLKNLLVVEISKCKYVTEHSLVSISKVRHLTKLIFTQNHSIFSEHYIGTITELHNLIHLNLSYFSIDDQFFENAGSNFPLLGHLNVSSCPVTDVGLARICQLHTLKHLDISECRDISDNGLVSLPLLPNLLHLACSGCSVSDQGLLHISKMRSLTSLNVSCCKGVTDQGLDHVSALTSLLALDMAVCRKVTDGGLVFVSRLTNLQYLNISCIKGFSNAGLEHIRNLKSLKCLIPVELW